MWEQKLTYHTISDLQNELTARNGIEWKNAKVEAIAFPPSLLARILMNSWERQEQLSVAHERVRSAFKKVSSVFGLKVHQSVVYYGDYGNDSLKIISIIRGNEKIHYEFPKIDLKEGHSHKNFSKNKFLFESDIGINERFIFADSTAIHTAIHSIRSELSAQNGDSWLLSHVEPYIYSRPHLDIRVGLRKNFGGHFSKIISKLELIISDYMLDISKYYSISIELYQLIDTQSCTLIEKFDSLETLVMARDGVYGFSLPRETERLKHIFPETA